MSLLAALFFPIILIGIAAAFRPVAEPDIKPTNSDENGNCVTQGYANPSAGILPWLQTIVCGVSPTCDGKSIPSLEHGSTDTFLSWNGEDLEIPCYKKGESVDDLSEKFAHDEGAYLELEQFRTGLHNKEAPEKVNGFSVKRFVADVKTLLVMMAAPKPPR